jgi:SRSO17 transposase
MDTIEETGMSLLEHPQAQSLLADAQVTAGQVQGCRRRLERFLERYVPLFYRKEQGHNAWIVVEGLLSGLERKTAEPIARDHGVPRKPIQFFVGSGKWDDEAVMAELRHHVVETLGDPQGVLVFDPSAFPKKGTHSCGVGRAWCGRLGKVENCQVGLFLAYATGRGQGPLDRRLYLPKEWAADRVRREEGHVPAGVKFQERWRMALAMLDRHRDSVPHRAVAADDEFGRVAAFRAGLRNRQEAYVLDVPCNTQVRDLQGRRPPRRAGPKTRRREVPFRRADAWAAAQPASRWQEFTVQDGQKGPIRVQAVLTPVRTRQEKRLGPQEWLLVIRHWESDGSEPDVSYHLAWAPQAAPLEQWVRVHARRHQIEQMLEHGRGEAGLDHYEVRRYVGWHHHLTLSLLALWFLNLERLAMGKKDAGGDGAAGTGDSRAAVAPSRPDGMPDCAGGQRRAPSQRTNANLPLARPHGSVPTASSSRRLRIDRLQ